MTGNGGADHFLLIFGAMNEDVITDFTRAQGDTIEIQFGIGVDRQDVEIAVADRRAGLFEVTVDGEGTHTFTAEGATLFDLDLSFF